ncbi:hypothetical protein SCLCIDRAFT_137392, partial [Scleroderma citrinum Foug A]
LGQKCVRLAAGGMIYILLILAGLNLRWCLTRVSWHMVSDLAKMLRVPASAGVEGKPIKQCIIPTIACMREELPLRLVVDRRILDSMILADSDRKFDTLEVQ